MNNLELAIQLSSLGKDRLKKINEAIMNTQNLNGEIWECGVWRGGTALYMAYLAKKEKTIRLFDTFMGMPYKSEYDFVEIGAMNDCDYNEVVKLFKNFPNCIIRKGVIPETFIGLKDSIISVAHIDVDNYDSTKACIEFIYPRAEKGGYIIIDDYYDPHCHGVKLAMDNYLKNKNEKLMHEHDKQAYLIKL